MSELNESIFDDIITTLEKYKGFYAQDYNVDINDNIESMKKRIGASKEEKRRLKIGIVGEVKAGKSSFLNALVFDGEDILPKACTPMTAALTKVTYGEKQSAIIHFYGVNAWRKIESYARDYDSTFEIEYAGYKERVEKANERNRNNPKNIKNRKEMKGFLEQNMPRWLVGCKELVDMSLKAGVDVESMLDTCKDLEIEDVKRDLEEYVGAHGKYTPLVEYVEIKMRDERFKEVEIVDTPGLNDPIVSRSLKTQKFLSECDVAFLLSYSGQFLTEADLSFMSKTLPREGIRNIIIVASKLDAGMLDDNKKKEHPHVQEARTYLVGTSNAQAKRNITKCIDNKYHSDIAKRLADTLPPSYVSSLLYSCANKKRKGIPLDETESHVLRRMSTRFSDFSADEESLLKLAGFNEVRRKCRKIMEEKGKIIEERDSKIIADSKNVLLGILEEINIQVIQNRDSVINSDRDMLEKKKTLIERHMNEIRKNIKNLFDLYSVNARKIMNAMKVEIVEEINNYQDLRIKIKHGHDDKKRDVGFLGLWKETTHYEVDNYAVNISDAVSNVRNYINACQRYINDEFEKIINERKIKEDLTRIIIGAFDLNDSNFKEDDILIPLEIIVKQMKIPKISVNNEDFEQSISNQFEASVHDEEISRLKLVQTVALENAAQSIQKKIEENSTEIGGIFSLEAATFVDNIIGKLNENMINIAKLIDDKENSIKRYDELLNDIQRIKKIICEME